MEIPEGDAIMMLQLLQYAARGAPPVDVDRGRTQRSEGGVACSLLRVQWW